MASYFELIEPLSDAHGTPALVPPPVTGPFISLFKTISAPWGVLQPALRTMQHTKLNQLPEPSLSTQVPIYPWVERSNYSYKYFLKDTSVMTVIRTQTLMTQLLALNGLATTRQTPNLEHFAI